jgi:biopolymer transport protein ExbD
MNIGTTEGDEKITEINVTPFVDVVLVLLLLFMSPAPSVYQSAMQVKLPIVSQPSQIKHITLHVFLNVQGDVQIDREKIRPEAIESLVKKAIHLDPAADAMISADHKVSHGQVLELFDALKRGGLREVALAAEEKKR